MNTTNRSKKDLAPSLYETIDEVTARLSPTHPQIARMFRQCFPNTLETTTEPLPDGMTFVFTGDIPAMWLRDSSAQVRPYVFLARRDPKIAAVIRGLIRRQAAYILIDAYANAFNREANDHHQNKEDRTEMGPWVWERKYELDSLCYPLQLLNDYWQTTGDASIFDESIHQMLRRIVEVMRIEQHHDQQSGYAFERDDEDRPLDTLPFDGRGTRTNFTGMVWSGFRPSDDACTFGYLVPANMFAVVVLGPLAAFARQFYKDADLAAKAEKLRREINFGIRRYGIVNHPRFGPIYAYETDGYGNYNLMDDANVPNLLSIPYLGYRLVGDPLYQRTRAFVLSPENPFYYQGKFAQGVGSPHTDPGWIWPIALMMQGLTSTSAQEQDQILDMLAATTAGTDYMHESFNPNDPNQFSREWFAWANSLFGEFVLTWTKRNTR